MKRNVLDAALLVVLLLLMSFQLLPKPLHEALGIAMGAFVLLHLTWNRGWLASLPRGRWSLGRAIPAVVNLALAVCFLLALVSGLAIANQLFHGVFGMAWQRSIVAHQVHITSSYALLILTGNEQAVLPTIRSRCMLVRVGAEDRAKIVARLTDRGIAPDRARLAAALSDGVPSLAERYAGEEYMAFRAQALPVIEESLFGVGKLQGISICFV